MEKFDIHDFMKRVVDLDVYLKNVGFVREEGIKIYCDTKNYRIEVMADTPTKDDND
jgi:hypothetical protein